MVIWKTGRYGQRKSWIVLSFTFNINLSQVERTSLDLVALSRKICEYNASSVSFPVAGDAEAVAVYINDLVSGCSEEDLWNNKPLLHFIDSSPSALSKMAEIYISIIQKEVCGALMRLITKNCVTFLISPSLGGGVEGPECQL